MDKQLAKISKYFSFILRHEPQAIGLTLDENGWAVIAELIDKTTDFELDLPTIRLVVESNDKQRFTMDNERGVIRANQGHSINVDLALEPLAPPPVLLHGTAERFIKSIKESGLVKQNRHHVHLSESKDVAINVGGRYGKPVLLEIDTQSMVNAGHQFYRSVNNVWLVESVPAEYIRFRNA